MTGVDSAFDMDAALVMATELGVDFVEQTSRARDEIAAQHGDIDCEAFKQTFAKAFSDVFRNIAQEAINRGGSIDEAFVVASAFVEACEARIAGGVQ